MGDPTLNKAYLTAIGSLQDFLDANSTGKRFPVSFKMHPAAKDLIESQGIPHTAIFKLEVNGTQKSLNYNVKEGDHIVIHPFDSVESSAFDPIYTTPESFIADVHLGKLVKTLRLLGFDTAFNQEWDDETIIARSNEKQRMILTRDLELLKHGDTNWGYWVRATNPDKQIEELFERFQLTEHLHPFTRCMECNGILQQTDLESIKELVPPKVQEWHSTYWQCSNCEQVYWQGSHFKKLKQKVERLKNL